MSAMTDDSTWEARMAAKAKVRIEAERKAALERRDAQAARDQVEAEEIRQRQLAESMNRPEYLAGPPCRVCYEWRLSGATWKFNPNVGASGYEWIHMDEIELTTDGHVGVCRCACHPTEQRREIIWLAAPG